jgi:hypothetical protein
MTGDPTAASLGERALALKLGMQRRDAAAEE